jgi:hypothetical protein
MGENIILQMWEEIIIPDDSNDDTEW